MGSSASSVLKSSRGGGRHGLLLFRSGCIKPYGIGDDESHELFIGRIQPDVFQLPSEHITREAREKASQGGVQKGAGQRLDAAKVEKHIEPLGQCGGRLLAQKSSVFGVDADRADLVDDFDCLHGLASPSSPGRIKSPSWIKVPRVIRCRFIFLGKNDGLTSRQEARERRIVTTVKPFAGTLRVTNPARKSRASSRKRVLHDGGQPPL